MARAPASIIIRFAGQAPHRRPPLSSNVRPHDTHSMSSREFSRHCQERMQMLAPHFWACSWPATDMKAASPRPNRTSNNLNREFCASPLAQAARPSAGCSPWDVRAQDQENCRRASRHAHEFWPKNHFIRHYGKPIQAAAAGAQCSLRLCASEVRPNPSVEPTRSGMAPWPRGVLAYHPPRGQGATPPRSAHLKR